MTENSAAPDPVIIVWAVTWDVVLGDRAPGGTATYAARAATALGVRAYVLVAAGADADLSAFAEHELAVVRVEQTMTLEHRFDVGPLRSGRRRQRALAHPRRPLHPSDLPAHWPEPRTLILGPLLPDDVDVAAFLDRAPGAEIALLAQGLQRAVAPDGAIAELDGPTAALLDPARPEVTICLSEEEAARWEPGHSDSGDWNALVARSRCVVVTREALGAEIRTPAGSHFVPALPARVVDATGAGDVFATALILAVRAGEEVAGRLAAACGAACVERRGVAPLPARAELEARAGITPDSLRRRAQQESAQGNYS
ncbi:MAG: hypothetical protein EXR68_03700 [Dehalococcoidia bacterium]|nr:hypothetical protein [Dehalococcoidia bacterium]